MNEQEIKAKIAELVAAGMPLEDAKKAVEEEAAELAKKAAEANEEVDKEADGEQTKKSTKTVDPDYDDIVDELIRRDNVKVYRRCVVTNATITAKPNYFMISLTLNRKLRAMRADADGEFVETTHNVIFSSNFALGGVIKHNRKINWLANDLVKNADTFKLIIINATVDIANEFVEAGTDYANPFTTTGNSSIMQNDTFVNHIINIEVDDDTAEDVREAKRSVLKDLIRGK